MVLTDFLTETRKRWLKAFKLFKGNKNRKLNNRNRISPSLVRSPSYSGTVDARSEIDLQRFCGCRSSMPPLATGTPDSAYENASYYSSFSSRACSEYDGTRSSDSAYDSATSSPAHGRTPVCYATVTYFNVNESEDSCSVRTEFTILEFEGEESAQNVINESIEMISTL